MKYLVAPYIAGFLVFLGVAFVIGGFVSAPTCEDGWRSSSIGIQGACSHHGGVERDPLRYFVVPSGLMVGFLTYGYISGLGFVRRGREKYERAGKIFCPRCGSEMKIKNGRYGRFYGCRSYPKCKTTFDLEEGNKLKEPSL